MTIACLLAVLAAGPAPVTFHARFDGTLEAEARGAGAPLAVEGPVAYRPGKVGQALLCGEAGAALTYATAGNLRAAAGTISLWVCPLDWTGAEDEFHVFLEALDPGWLVFYRYYQGGLTLLTGSDGEHYRAAGSARPDWRPGEWHHLAGTWRASRLRIFVDGEYVGGAEQPILPAALAERFLVGDRPWHVPRRRQSLIDELEVYSVPLEAGAIAQLARGEAPTYEPRILVDWRAIDDGATVEVACDAAGLAAPHGPGLAARVELVPAGTDAALLTSRVETFTTDFGRCRLPFTEVPPGEFTLRTALLGAGDAVICRAETPLTRPAPPDWRAHRLGLADRVLPPWTPLRADRAAATVACWDRAYRYAGQLAGVRSGNDELLASPVTLEAVVGGRTVAIDGPAAVESATDTRAVLAGSAVGAGLRAEARHTIEYDGFSWSDLTIAADQPVQVDELRLTWTMPAAAATLYHADKLRWIENPAGALPAGGWTSEFTHFVWLGNEDRGLSWCAESDRDWVASTERPAIELKPEGGVVRATIRLIAAQTRIDAPRTYGYGFQATPVRPQPTEPRRLRMTPAPRPTFHIVWPNDAMAHYGYTEPADPARFAALVAERQASGCRVVPYINLNFVSDGVPEWRFHGAAWADPARVVTPADVAAMGHPSMGVCPASEDWQAFILKRLEQMIDRYRVDGIYIDCWGPSPCQQPPCGWRDAEGQLHGTRPIRAYRAILRRVATLFREKRPDPLLMIHMSSEVNIPMLSFAETLLDGEQFGPGVLLDDYLPLLPPDKFRAEFLGRNWGPVAFFLPEFREPHVVPATPTLAAYLLLHDVQPWPIWSDTALWTRLYDRLDALGYATAEFRPYWRPGPIRSATPGVLVSAYRLERGWLLAVQNTGEATDAVIALPAERARAVDLLTDQPLAVVGGAVQVPLERHQGRIVHLAE